MVAPDPLRIAALSGLILASSCAAPPPARPAEPPVAAEKPAAEAPAPEPSPTPAPAPERDDQVVVLDPGGEEKGSGSSLVEAARAERERRAHAGPPVAVITDKNLKHYATGQLTVATPGKKADVAPPAAGGPEQPVRDEQYWRSRALEIRLRWRHAADDVKELEKSTAGWRRSFYAERDPYVRDGKIKPEWDRALDRLEEARTEVEAARKELAELLEEGRTAGALPGWLREGLDQEPKEEPAPSDTHPVIEPPRADQDGHGA
jgi:hypothetical protein